MAGFRLLFRQGLPDEPDPGPGRADPRPDRRQLAEAAALPLLGTAPLCRDQLPWLKRLVSKRYFLLRGEDEKQQNLSLADGRAGVTARTATNHLHSVIVDPLGQ